MKWGSEQHLLPPLRHENVENVESVECLENLPCSGRLDFMHRRDRSEHLASPEVASVARGGWGGSVEASGLKIRENQ